MHCILIDNPGPKSRLLLGEQAIPGCKKDDVLIRVRATALNRADLLQRQGKYPPPPGESSIPGLEVAGEVVAIGTHVTRFKIGERIYGLVGSGGYADYCCVNQNLAASMPAHWDFTYAAALPEALTTAHATVCLLGQLKSNQSFLIHGAGSGISSIAIQMAKLKSAKIITTASSEDKIAKAKELGAHVVINYKKDDFETVLGEKSIDLIVDFIGGTYFHKHLKLLKTLGKLIQIACMQGSLAEANLLLMMHKRLQINGFVLRSQSLAEKVKLWQSMQKQWGTALLNQHLIPIIDSEFSLREIEEAQAHMRKNAHFGKIVVRIPA